MNPLTPLTRRVEREEEMDELTLPDARFARVLTHLARINRLTLAARPTLSFVARVAAKHKQRPLKILDVGFGDGGMLRTIARHGAKQGIALDLTGVDLNSRSETVARALHTPDLPPIHYLTGDYGDLAGHGWDIILSSLVTHHMSDGERGDFLRFMEDEAAAGWFVNDLHRQRFPFAGYPMLATLAMVDPIVRRDGQLSIARSFRVGEWQAMLAEAGIGGALVQRWFPYRLCVERIK
jgi:SAM-dependent methyltransferase